MGGKKSEGLPAVMRDAFTPRMTKYIPWTPTVKQAVFLSPVCNMVPEVLFGGAAGGAKALHTSVVVPTPAGWTTMGELRVGDEVLDEQGVACRVTAVSAVMLGHRCYRVRFSDGAEVVADEEHLWLTYTARDLAALTRRTEEWRRARREKRPSRVSGLRSELFTTTVTERNRRLPTPAQGPAVGGIRTTAEIAATLTVGGGRANHAIPVAEPLELPEADLLVDPYVLGAWLGDGSSASSQICAAEGEIVEAIASAGWEVRRVPSSPYSWCVRGLQTSLRQLGVLGNKHIPAAYLRSSREQRIALLQGLMDTDGHATDRGACEFTNTRRALMDGVLELLASLGVKATSREGRAKLYGKDCGAKWKVKFTAPFPVFRLARKALRQRLDLRRTSRFRYVVAVEPVPSVPVRCITVDSSSHLYLAGRAMIPTHNSVALLMGALQYVDVPGYNALLLRKTFPELTQPGALIDLAEQWLTNTDASWNGETHTWTFPSGATVSFGYLEQERQRFRYAGSAYAYIGFDELSAFPEKSYRFLFSRLRKTAASEVPLRMRATSNPGGVGHEWVRRRFLEETSDRRAFIPSKLQDNPHLDYESYVQSLSELDPVTRRQLLEGDWTAREVGGLIRREWFEVVDAPPRHLLRVVRYLDLAATGKTDKNDPDWTAGAKLAKDLKGDFYLLHMFRFRGGVGEVERALKHLAVADGVEVPWFIEQEPGSSGKIAMDHLQRTVLAGHAVTPVKATGTRGATNASLGAKVVRAGPMASAAQAGRIKVVRGTWNEAFFDEVDLFPQPGGGVHDDQVDAISGAFAQLHRRGSVDGIAEMNRSLGENRVAAELYGLAVDEDLRRGLA